GAGGAGGEFGAGADPELAVDAAQVVLDGVHADKQRLRDFPVGVTGGRQLSDPFPGRGEVLRRGGPQADARQLRPGPLRPQRGAEPLEDLHGFLEGLAGGPLLFEAPKDLAFREQGPPELERDGESRMVSECQPRATPGRRSGLRSPRAGTPGTARRWPGAGRGRDGRLVAPSSL